MKLHWVWNNKQQGRFVNDANLSVNNSMLKGKTFPRIRYRFWNKIKKNFVVERKFSIPWSEKDNWNYLQSKYLMCPIVMEHLKK